MYTVQQKMMTSVQQNTTHIQDKDSVEDTMKKLVTNDCDSSSHN